MLHQVGDLFELNVKLRCQKVNIIGPAMSGLPSDHIMRSYSIHIPYFTLTGVNVLWAPVSCQRDLVLSSTNENSFDLEWDAGEGRLVDHYDH